MCCPPLVFRCHGAETKMGNLDPDGAAVRPEGWQGIFEVGEGADRVKEGEKQPEPEQVDAFLEESAFASSTGTMKRLEMM